jgi:uncharacterized radical SAM superfamily Fe-S cluster-containing enzyme
MKTFKKRKYTINYNLRNEQIADLIVTDKCNMSCPFCIASYMLNIDKLDLDIETLKEYVLPLLKEKDITHVGISGGEPTVNKNLLEICKILKEEGYEINIASNGHDFDLLSKCSEYINYVSLSLNFLSSAKINELNRKLYCQLRVHGLIYKNHYDTLNSLTDLRDELDKSIILDFSTLRTTNEWTIGCGNKAIENSNAFTTNNKVGEAMILKYGEKVETKNGVIVKIPHDNGNIDIILRDLSVQKFGEPTDKQLIITYNREHFYGFNDLIKKYI